MVKLFIGLGLALLAGGAYAIVDGWPYRVLERGFTEVILGALAVTAGLLLLALAALLAELRRVKGMVGGAMAMMSLSEPRAEPAAADEAFFRKVDAGARDDDAAAEPKPTASQRPADIGIETVAAGAGALAAGGALASLSRDDAKDAADARDVTAEPEDEPAAPASGEADAAPQEVPAVQPPEPLAAGDHDDWLWPPDPAPPHAAEREPSIEAVHAEPETPVSAAKGEPQDAGAETDEAAAAPAGPAEADAAPAEDETQTAGEGSPEPAAIAAPEDKVWWPRIDRSERDRAAGSADDDFDNLRDALSGAMEAPPVVEPPRREPVLGGDWLAPRPWPPVTQPRDLAAADEPEVVPQEEAERDEPAALQPEPTSEIILPPEPEAAPPETSAGDEGEAAEEAAEQERDEDDAQSPPPAADERPAASEEGVIGAYQVGETHFTMYADGSIHANTPDGDYVFASMDELKTYLASEKSKLEPSG